MGHVAKIVKERWLTRKVQDAGARFAHRFDGGIARIDHADAIDLEAVFPDAGIDGANGGTPNSVGVLGHRGATIRPLAIHEDLIRLVGADAEGDPAILADFGGAHRRLSHRPTRRGVGGGDRGRRLGLERRSRQ
jgi:hypothetical protein